LLGAMQFGSQEGARTWRKWKRKEAPPSKREKGGLYLQAEKSSGGDSLITQKN